MSNYSQYKQKFIWALSESGLSSVEAAPPDIRTAVPEPTLQKWVNRFYRIQRPESVPQQPRLINRFMLGADPEFMFVKEGVSGSGAAQASAFGLSAGLCFGADNNGRLVELRPEPNRFALSVVASMLLELRWLATLKPKTLPYIWKAGAYANGDGLGGHIHFGRKRSKSLATESQALDRLCRLLFATEAYPSAEQILRTGNTPYGKYGVDHIRRQKHGYEYRTFPSWLGSPWLAYLSLVLAKLFVLNPFLGKEFTTQQAEAGPQSNATLAKRFIRNVLARYKDLDDDAKIAYAAMSVWGMPHTSKMAPDFKQSWGIMAQPPTDFERLLLPQTIVPTEKSLKELLDHLVVGRPLIGGTEAPNWPYTRMSNAKFIPIQERIQTQRSPGLGEVSWDLMTFEPFRTDIQYHPPIPSPHKRALGVTQGLFAAIGQKRRAILSAQFPDVELRSIVSSSEFVVCLTKSFLEQPKLAETKRLLTCGIFPLAQFGQEAQLEKWQPSSEQKKKVRKSISLV